MQFYFYLIPNVHSHHCFQAAAWSTNKERPPVVPHEQFTTILHPSLTFFISLIFLWTCFWLYYNTVYNITAVTPKLKLLAFLLNLTTVQYQSLCVKRCLFVSVDSEFSLFSLLDLLSEQERQHRPEEEWGEERGGERGRRWRWPQTHASL